MNRTLQTHCKYQYTSLVQKHNVDNMQTLAYANGFPVGSIYMKYDMHCFHLLSSSRRNCTGFYFFFNILFSFSSSSWLFASLCSVLLSNRYLLSSSFLEGISLDFIFCHYPRRLSSHPAVYLLRCVHS